MADDARPLTWPGLIATAVLWLTGLAVMLLTFGETASPCAQQEPARQ